MEVGYSLGIPLLSTQTGPEQSLDDRIKALLESVAALHAYDYDGGLVNEARAILEVMDGGQPAPDGRSESLALEVAERFEIWRANRDNPDGLVRACIMRALRKQQDYLKLHTAMFEAAFGPPKEPHG